MSEPTITIIRRPDGEAPEWVRDAWIGLELPLAEPEPVMIHGEGVLSGPRTGFGRFLSLIFGTGASELVIGYAVVARTAVDLLDARAPEAAKWWRENAPHLLKDGGQFIFDRPSCAATGQGTIAE